MNITEIKNFTDKIKEDMQDKYTFMGSEKNKCLSINSQNSHVEIKYDDIKAVSETYFSYIIFTESERVICSKRHNYISKEYMFEDWQRLEKKPWR